MDRGLVEHFDELAMNLGLYGFLCIFGIQYMYGTSSSSSLGQKKGGRIYGCPALLICRKISEMKLYLEFQGSD